MRGAQGCALEWAIWIKIQLRLIDAEELPIPRGRSGPPPGEGKGLAQAVDLLHDEFPNRPTLAADLDHRTGRGFQSAKFAIVSAIFDREKNERLECRPGILERSRFVVAPSVREISGQKGPGCFPVPSLDFFQKMSRMQANLAFGLPQPVQPQAPKEQDSCASECIFPKIHERK